MGASPSSVDLSAFEGIDWSAPLDAATWIDGVPSEHQIRGMFPDKVAKLAAESGHAIGRSRYIAFKFYPLKEHIELMAEAVPLLYPDAGMREGLRRLGAHATPTLQDSMIGRVFSSFVGGSPVGALSLVGKSYTTTRNGGTAKTVHYEEQRHLVISFRDVWDYPEALHVGIVEAFLQGMGIDWTARVRRIAPSHIEVCVSNPSPPA